MAKITGGEAPSPDTADNFKECFDIMIKDGMKQAQSGLSKASEEAKSCMRSEMGSDIIGKVQSGDESAMTPEFAVAIEKCMASELSRAKEQIDEALSQVPAEMKSCITNKLGSDSDMEEKLKDGTLDENSISNFINDCAKSFTPSGPPSGSGGGENEQSGGGMPTEPTSDMCSQFKMAPSCDYLPAEYQELCKKCK